MTMVFLDGSQDTKQRSWSCGCMKCFLVFIWVVCNGASGSAAEPTEAIFQFLAAPEPTGIQLSESSTDDSASRLRTPVDLHPKLEEPGAIAAGDVWELPLPDGRTYTIRFDRVRQNLMGTRTLRARVDGNPMGYVIISTTDGESFATIRIPGEGTHYEISRPGDDAGYYLISPEQTQPALCCCSGPGSMVPPPPTEEEKRETGVMLPLSVNDPLEWVTIDVMMVYTPAARQWAESRGGIANLLNQGMEMANLALENSDVFITKRLVHTAEVSYIESGDLQADLRRLTTSPAFRPFGSSWDGYNLLGFMDEVHAWRDQYGADLVALVVDEADSGGRAWLLGDPNGRPHYGFSVTSVHWVDGLIHAHEMGHNMGLGHHKEQNSYPGPGLFGYSAGWRWRGNSGGRHVSVMSYWRGRYFDDGQDHARVPYFSNPHVNYDGVPTGHPVDGDNARTLRETKHAVAAYRSTRVAPTREIALSGDLDFGEVMVNQRGTRALTIRNLGDSPLYVSGITFPGDFSGDWSSGVIAPGGSETVTVTYAPTSEQVYSGNVTVFSDRTSGANTRAISGTGIPIDPLWDRAARSGEWLALPWFGWFANLSTDWINHAEHSWWYSTGESTDAFYFYDMALGMWGWSSEKAYPWIYWLEPMNTWTFNLPGGQAGARRFFNPESGGWYSEDALSMVLVEGGTFAMGDHKNELESWMARSRPVHDVYVSAFYMARTPVTYAEWKEVYDWAVANGYSFDNPGQRGAGLSGLALPDTPVNNRHPVTRVSWYDVVKWCNAKSEREGLTPVYHTDDTRTSVYRQGRHDVTIAQVDWIANGYRLPTEAEWEKAARGGLVGARWPWGDAGIDDTRANYGRNVNSTTPVGSYAANGYGLHDMAGNVYEWNWDRFSGTWYSQPAASEADTRGPVSGSLRVFRGGSWSSDPEYSRVANRDGIRPFLEWNGGGFRLVRTQ